MNKIKGEIVHTKKTVFNISEEKISKIAVLIDADNASARDIDYILTEITKYGEATVKRIYGNFTDQVGNAWKKCINDLAIKPMQQFSYTTGKNATDGFMIIDAMDLLYTNRFDGFCIISSDSDFTALAIRIKEQGATVYGFGKKQTPKAFVNACSHFTYVENLHPVAEICEPQKAEPVVQVAVVDTPKVTSTVKPVKEKVLAEVVGLPMALIQQIFEDAEEEWLAISVVGQRWKLKQVDFDPRSYGAKNFSTLVKKFPNVFEWEERDLNGHKHVYVKLKQ